MLIKEILNTKISPLQPDDTIGFALTRLDLLRVPKFAVVDAHNVLAGMVSLSSLLEYPDQSQKLSEIELEKPLYVPEHQHLFEGARRMLAQELYIMPVTDAEMHFKGTVHKNELIKALSELFNIASYGSVLTIEMKPADFTLSEMVRIIETEGAKILGIAVQQPNADHPRYRVSVKLNLEDTSALSRALRRFGFDITAEAGSEILEHNYSERADELIRYLDI